jgi:GNAT superfamily N-acetyltransferase
MGVNCGTDPEVRVSAANAYPVPEIEFLPVASATDAGVVATVTGLINSVYKTSEDGLWIEGALRTTEAEVATLIRHGELAAATSEGIIVGSVRTHRLDPQVGEFGMLAAAPARRGLGIGRALVAFAEDWARRSGLASMQLEVLTPRDWTHPSKAFLMQWYERIGYRHIRTGALDEAYPALAPLLATPCDFAVYRKDLSK